MAQRTEKEETEFKVVPETMSLCVKCGVAGNSSAANNLCQKCFNATAAASTSVGAVAKPLNHVLLEKSFRSSSFLPERRLASAATNRDLKREASVAAIPMKREVNLVLRRWRFYHVLIQIKQ